MGRITALVLAALVVGACSSDPGSDEASIPSAATTDPSASVRVTTEALTERVPLPVPDTAPPPPTLSAAAGVDPEELLAAPAPQRFSLVELPETTIEALNDRFRHEDVVEEVLRGVSARGVRLDDRVTGVVLAVAVAPPVAADAGFQQSFQAQATEGAEVEAETFRVGDQEMVHFVADGVHSVLWQRENVFLLVSSRNAEDLLRSARALVSTVVAPVQVDGDLDGDLIADPGGDGDDIPDPTAP